MSDETTTYNTDTKTLNMHEAVQQRGISFINAALLMVENLTDEQKSKINNVRTLSIRKKLKDQQQYPDNITCIKNYFEHLTTFWENSAENSEETKLTNDDLAALVKELIAVIQENIYLGEKSFTAVKKELDSAEHHVCWAKKRISNVAREGNITRTEEPMAWFTKKQIDEWLSILNENQQPKWFTSLPEWEQHYLHQKVTAWTQLPNEKDKENLGEFLDSLPSTIRGYPGAANAYTTKFQVAANSNNNNSAKQTFTKIRTGYFVPIGVKDFDEKVRITKQNIEQLLAVSIREHIEQEKTRSTRQSEISLPLLIQTLHSPPFEPGNKGNKALFKAIDELREELNSNDANNITQFFTNLEVDIPEGITIKKIDILYVNNPINAARGLAKFLSFFTRHAGENAKTIKSLKEYFDERFSGSQEENPERSIAQAALTSLNSQRSFWNTYSARNLLCYLPFVKLPKSNAMVEQAALQQIIASKLGIRIGGCKSGKDREEMVTEIALAMTELYAKYGRMPPHANYSKTGDVVQDNFNKVLRDEFITMTAKHFLSGHGQKLAADNSTGCTGLKNIKDILCDDICTKIKRLVPNNDPIADNLEIASLNRISIRRLKKNNLDAKRQTIRKQVLATIAAQPSANTETPYKPLPAPDAVQPETIPLKIDSQHESQYAKLSEVFPNPADDAGTNYKPLPARDAVQLGTIPSEIDSQSEHQYKKLSDVFPKLADDAGTNYKPLPAPDAVQPETVKNSEIDSQSGSSKEYVTQSDSLKEKTTNHLNSIIQEILQTEKTYHANLKHFVDNFITSLQKNRSLNKNPEAKTLLNNLAVLAEIATLANEILSELQQATSNPDINEQAQNVTNILANHAKELEQLYSNYARTYMETIKLHQNLLANKKFNKLCAAFIKNPTSENKSPADFMIMPVQRMPRYKLLIKEVFKIIPESLKENIKHNLNSLETITETINRNANPGSTINDHTEPSCNETLTAKAKAIATTEDHHTHTGYSNFGAILTQMQLPSIKVTAEQRLYMLEQQYKLQNGLNEELLAQYRELLINLPKPLAGIQLAKILTPGDKEQRFNFLNNLLNTYSKDNLATPTAKQLQIEYIYLGKLKKHRKNLINLPNPLTNEQLGRLTTEDKEERFKVLNNLLTSNHRENLNDPTKTQLIRELTQERNKIYAQGHSDNSPRFF